MLTTPAVLNALLSLVANPATLAPLQTTLPVKLPVNFASVAGLQIITGTYTPGNDTKTIVTALSAISPNFLVFMCDGIANLSSDNGMLALVPVNKLFMQTLTSIVGGTNPINALTLSGLLANPYPMIQGQALNYTLILGQALIT